MTSAGEAPVGPEEYDAILPGARDRILVSTNVGVRVNTRLHQPLPEFAVAEAMTDEAQWLKRIFQCFLPYIHTPDGVPRPLTVRLRVEPGCSAEALRKLIPQIEAGRRDGRLGIAGLHRLSLLYAVAGSLHHDLERVEQLLALAKELKVPEVAVDGEPVTAARRRLSAQGLLNVLEPIDAARLLRAAQTKGVALTYNFDDDEESASRTVWAGLESARTAGLNGGKYGLVPLTLDKQRFVIEKVQRWMKNWTAIPAFYVDTPLVTQDGVFDSDRCVEAARLWMKMAAEAGAKVVLVDAPDRIRPRRLLKAGSDDHVGVLTIDDVRGLKEHGDRLGLEILWSGGILPDQVFELAKLGVFGIFTTGSASRRSRVEGALLTDRQLAETKEPTEIGVRRIHGLIQAGFLCGALGNSQTELVQAIESGAKALLDNHPHEDDFERALAALNRLLVNGWTSHWECSEDRLQVPPDAVRVWRGFRRDGLTQAKFVEKLGSIFLPATVQIQSHVGLTAYLPTVLPASKPPAIPDEIALVFYRYQRAYDEAKETVGGRAYGDLHELVFDLNKSTSGFPQRFSGTLEPDEKYYLFDRAVDWQHGQANVFVGVRTAEAPNAFRDSIARCLLALQQNGASGPDAAIVTCSWDYVVYWEHWPEAGAAAQSNFANLAAHAEPVHQESILPFDMTDGLWSSTAGVEVAAGKSFNFRFARNGRTIC